MFSIDYRSGVPISEQICRSVVKLGAAGAFGEDGRLPSVRLVARELGINPNTVQKAYSMLERDGIIHSLPGKGSFLVSDGSLQEKRRREALEKLTNALTEGLECGVSPEEIDRVVQKALEAFEKAPKPLDEDEGGNVK